MTEVVIVYAQSGYVVHEGGRDLTPFIKRTWAFSTMQEVSDFLMAHPNGFAEAKESDNG